jgi:hypothetical protein
VKLGKAAEQLKGGFSDAGARDLDSLEASFATLSDRWPEALLVTAEPFTNLHCDRILVFVSRGRISAIYEDVREPVVLLPTARTSQTCSTEPRVT